jgi:hypothetical protein
VSPSLPSVNDVCDRQLVTDEQGGIVVSVFFLSHILGGFSLNFCFPPFHILASLPLLLNHRTSTYLASRPCSTFPSLPCPWLEREPPQSGRCTHTQAVCVPLPQAVQWCKVSSSGVSDVQEVVLGERLRGGC